MTTHSEQLAEVLESPACFCGRVKKMQQPFCGHCFYSLPPAAREFVRYIRNDTYHGAYDAAIEWLRRYVYVNQSPA